MQQLMNPIYQLKQLNVQHDKLVTVTQRQRTTKYNATASYKQTTVPCLLRTDCIHNIHN